MHPKVFVSHASEDKGRFVTGFATKLRENGVDAWLDKWEMLPGDSLVDKIFEEGLKEAQAVIIVLSNYSIKKLWVREELNASIVSKLSKGTKIIPIVLDNCEVPQSLTHTLWEPIPDLKNYEQNFKRVLSSIFGTTDKPALGKAPAYTTSVYHEIGGLTKADNLVLKESCEYIIQNDGIIVSPESLFGDGDKLGFSRAEIKDCIEVLEQNGYLDVSRYFGSGDDYSCNYRVTTYGLDNFTGTYIPDYSETLDKAVSLIVNERASSNFAIQEKTGKPIVIINHILDVLESNDHIKLSKTLDGAVHIYNVSASLRRALA
ncbi:toll/interleukin-1 receptor domain-containing protein [Pseudoalteromonas sp. APC 3213]|uniref:toll/interleukin-1 receptor domain-containing protein n=1 Tax=Pseudoalteromonas sp. APC 3213 TaxID=3035178 RepID=UPI0025B5D846|nr:toll/interleukin-1 receptor domain-containing protein [Pseudoalteromonas sp. APC 3213]MDN3403345.1 toll/interleukin-1 receptor domain-containing protein [Pseudoalteromonas sp. APC 3213]